MATASTLLPYQDKILSAIVDTEPDVVRISYGGGYSQRTARGFNHIDETMQVDWIALSKLELQNLRHLLAASGGVSLFSYTTDASTTLKYWSLKSMQTGVQRDSRTWDLSASFQREYDIIL